MYKVLRIAPEHRKFYVIAGYYYFCIGINIST